VPGLIRLIDSGLPSGRYHVEDVAETDPVLEPAR
jgi:hypothetical protein